MKAVEVEVKISLMEKAKLSQCRRERDINSLGGSVVIQT